MLDEILAAVGLKKAAAIGGFVGATVSLKFFPDMNLWQGATTLLSGWAVASFSAPLVTQTLSLSDKHEGGIGFLVGVIGMAVISNLLKAMPDWIAAAKVRAFGSDDKG